MWGRRRSERATSITIDNVRRQRIPLSWQEAVAIVLETGDSMHRAGRGSVPRLENLELTSNGSIALNRGQGRAGDPVAALVAMLYEIMPASSPAQLRAFLSAAESPASTLTTMPDFVEALRYYERPGREQILAEVYDRARRAVESTSAEDGPDAFVGETEDRLSSVHQRRRRQLMVATILLAVVGASVLAAHTGVGFVRGPMSSLQAMAGGWWTRVRDGASALQEAASRDLAAVADQLGETPVEDGLVEAGNGSEATATTAAPRSTPAPHSGDARLHRARAAAPRPSGARTEATGSTENGEDPDTEAAAVAAFPLDGVDRGWLPDPVERHVMVEHGDLDVVRTAIPQPGAVRGVFDRRNPDVVPPVAVKLPLPSELAELPWSSRIGLVEAIVSESGEVERVKLLSAVFNVHEAMLLSAVKTWRFSPARKDGVPVRYRHLIPVSARH